MRLTLLHPAAAALLPAGAATVLAPSVAFAATYLDLAQAQTALFPAADRFTPQLLAAPTPGGRPLQAWRAWQGEQPLGLVVVDSVLGKFELIDYAIGIDRAGALRQVEIMAYRESHGHEVRLPAWRRQFVGKTASAPLRVGEDITNISGATLSSQHLTDRIRAVLRQLSAAGLPGA